MRSSDLYLFTILLLIGVFLFGAHYLRYQHDVVLEQDGYQLINVDQSQTIWPHKEPIVFILEKAGSLKEIYKFNGYEQDDFSSINYSYYSPSRPYQENDYYFIEAFKNSLPFQKEMEDLSFEERYDLIHSEARFEGRQLIQHNLEPGLFGYVDTMPLIFLVIGLFAFVIFKTIDLIALGLCKITKSNRAVLVLHIILILFLIAFLTLVRLTPWFPTSQLALLIRNAIVIIPVFTMIKIVKRRYADSSAFWKYQFINFVIILIVGNLLLWIGNEIGYMIDLSTFEKISHKPFFCTYDSLAIGILMSCAIGLLVRDVVDEWYRQWQKAK